MATRIETQSARHFAVEQATKLYEGAGFLPNTDDFIAYARIIESYVLLNEFDSVGLDALVGGTGNARG